MQRVEALRDYAVSLGVLLGKLTCAKTNPNMTVAVRGVPGLPLADASCHRESQSISAKGTVASLAGGRETPSPLASGFSLRG